MINDYKIQNEEKQYMLGELAVKGNKLFFPIRDQASRATVVL